MKTGLLVLLICLIVLLVGIAVFVIYSLIKEKKSKNPSDKKTVYIKIDNIFFFCIAIIVAFIFILVMDIINLTDIIEAYNIIQASTAKPLLTFIGSTILKTLVTVAIIFLLQKLDRTKK